MKLQAILCSLLFGAVYSSSPVIRRGRHLNKTPIAQYEGCSTNPEFMMVMIGERDDPDPETFMPLDHSLPAHTKLLGYNENQIAGFWEEASDFFYELTGVDFRNIPLKDGMKVIDGDWMLEPRRINMNLRLVFDTYHGNFKCPREFGDEGITMVPLRSGLKYFGKYGGEEGIDAVTDDIFAFGAYIIDFGGFGHYERLKYHGTTPYRKMDDQIMLSSEIESDHWGYGKSDGKIAFSTENGVPHASFRMFTTFPARFNL